LSPTIHPHADIRKDEDDLANSHGFVNKKGDVLAKYQSEWFSTSFSTDTLGGYAINHANFDDELTANSG